MTSLLRTVAPKSDQLNADDLIGGVTKTIKVTKVTLAGEVDQPVSIHFEGDNGKPYKPCKSMRRVLIHVWGDDGSAYVGRSMTLYCDPEVKFGGAKVGGIRISHMSNISEPVTMALTATKAQRKPYTVKPLVQAPAPEIAPEVLEAGRQSAQAGVKQYADWLSGLVPAVKATVRPYHAELSAMAKEAEAAKGE